MKNSKGIEMYNEDKDFLKNYQHQLIEEDDIYFRNKGWERKGYLCHGKRKRKIFTVHGILYINRRYYYNRKTKQGYFYLDNHYNWGNRQRIGADLKQTIINGYGIIPVTEMAEQFGISRATIFNVLKEAGVATNNHRKVKICNS